ncbi:siderophore-interacting protein [Methylobrevis albus]|uniref:Siderophore-interacting protein n=1 Tax=Methylobrevis albus TaxID=2793297 RepID=A0A931MZQ8_9HYPH|nr:siderophore-interacting protein [Methylobrevis albus]MBH0238344.1 siderophore-interacting protein [Methylobrevis albus]
MTELAAIAVAEIPLAAARDVFERLCAHLDEHVDIRRDGWSAEARTPFVRVGFSSGERMLRFDAHAVDTDYLAAVKDMVASHVAEFAGDLAAPIVWTSPSATAAPEEAERPRGGRCYREMRVTAVRDLSPRMRRLTLAGDDLGPFEDGGLHVRLVLPDDPAVPPPAPRIDAGGRLAWDPGVTPPPVRVYTIRRIDVAAGTVEIDFVLHGDGADAGHGETAHPASPGARFALRAVPGAVLGMYGPGGRTVPAAARYLLAGDETALPMIARVLEALPATASAVVRIEVETAADKLPLQSAATLDIAFLPRRGAAPGVPLAEAVEALPIDAADAGLFVLFAAETTAARRIRTHLRGIGLPPERYIAAGFWDA